MEMNTIYAVLIALAVWWIIKGIIGWMWKAFIDEYSRVKLDQELKKIKLEKEAKKPPRRKKPDETKKKEGEGK